LAAVGSELTLSLPEATVLALRELGDECRDEAFFFNRSSSSSSPHSPLRLRALIRGFTRTMTTTTALQTSRGELALALGLGLILMGLTLAISAAAFF
jgi:hypothetical protein